MSGRLLAVALVPAAALCAALAAHLWAELGATMASASTNDAPAWQPPLRADEPPADWCAPPYEPIAGGACFAAAGAPADDPLLIIYLHGRYARSAPGDELDRQHRVAQRANARGWSVLALRGSLGACKAAELSDWFCWPTADGPTDVAAAVIEAWARALAAIEQREGHAPLALFGFSNGGYFASLLVTRGLVDVRAATIAHGGPVGPVEARSLAPPLLLLSADDDVAQDDMIVYDELLSRARWPHDSYARTGAHGLTDDDIQAALTFFARSKEAMPLDPPLRAHRAVRHVRAEPEAEVEDSAAPGPAAEATPYDDDGGAED